MVSGIRPLLPNDYLAAGLFCLLVCLTEFKPIRYNQNVTQTVSTAIAVASIFIFPPSATIIITSGGSLASDIYLRRTWYKTLFNAAHRTITAGLPALLAHELGIYSLSFIDSADLLRILSVLSLYFILATTIMGVLIAVATGEKILRGWRDAVTVFSSYDLSLLPYGLMLAWMWQANPWLFFVGLLPLVAIQHSFAVHAGLINEQEASRRLTQQQRQIHEATTSLLSSVDIHSQIDTMMKYIMEVFPVTHSSVLLWGEGNEQDQVVSRGTCTPELPIRDWSLNLRRVCEARRLVHLDHEFVRKVMTGQPVMLVPLVTPDDVVGCMVLVTDSTFTLDEQGERLIETFAAQAALAIYQARLITKLKSSQVRVVQSERLAAIGTLAAGVAHEFNNLLAGISGISQLALLEDEPGGYRSALDTVAKSAQHGGSITRGLLTFARHLEPKREPADLRSAIDPVLSMLQAEFRRGNIRVEQRITPVRPVLCDIGTLAQVMLNLVTNAIDAMTPTGGVLTIELAEEAEHIRLAVGDTGCGIPSHVRDRIFEPFVSTKTSNDGKLHGGSGLGLAISYGIIAEHDGTIDIESEEGRGTTMTIRLPLKAAPAEVVLAPQAQLEPLRMIIVDDEPLIAKSLHGLLTKEGHAAEWFTEPVKALEAISQAPVDVIFADLMMPEMDGVTLLQRAKQRVPEALQVVVTGHADARQIERVQALGVSAVIEKPFTLDAIRTVVSSLRRAPVLPASH